MFDIGFSELVLCLLVALVVIGPEQLPQAVRSVALWVGRLKRSLRDTREEIERQIGADDIRRQLHNEEIMRSLEETNRRIQDTMEAASANARELAAQAQLEAPTANVDTVNGAASAAPAPAFEATTAELPAAPNAVNSASASAPTTSSESAPARLSDPDPKP